MSCEDLEDCEVDELFDECLVPELLLELRLSCFAFFIMSFSLLSALIIWMLGVALGPESTHNTIFRIILTSQGMRWYSLEVAFFDSLDFPSGFGELLSLGTYSLILSN